METEPAFKMLHFLKKLDDGQSPKKEDCGSELESCSILSFGFLGP
jgi:hypothetical protein